MATVASRVVPPLITSGPPVPVVLPLPPSAVADPKRIVPELSVVVPP